MPVINHSIEIRLAKYQFFIYIFIDSLNSNSLTYNLMNVYESFILKIKWQNHEQWCIIFQSDILWKEQWIHFSGWLFLLRRQRSPFPSPLLIHSAILKWERNTKIIVNIRLKKNTSCCFASMNRPPEARLIHTLSKFHCLIHEIYLTNHHSSHKHVIYGKSCLLLAFLNSTTYHLLDLRSIKLIWSLTPLSLSISFIFLCSGFV